MAETAQARGCTILIGLVFMIAVAVGVLLIWNPVVGTISAAETCHKFVRQQLKAPSTAKFGSNDRTSQTGSTYTIVGSVDAENSFGAPLHRVTRAP